MKTELRPTPETDALHAKQGLTHASYRDFARKLERERDEARERERVAVASWNEERLRGQREAERVVALQQQLEAMREAIKEAHEALMLAPYRDQEALAKLQPFLKL